LNLIVAPEAGLLERFQKQGSRFRAMSLLECLDGLPV
jgi:hypothetical protein